MDTNKATNRAPQSKLRRGLRLLGFVVLGFLLLLITTLGGGLIYLKSNSAREKVLAFGLKKAQPAFPGGLVVKSSEGDLTKGLVLHDVELRDLDGRPAVKIARLEVKYSLLPLLVTRVQVDIVHVDGLTIISQPLADGRDNLATISTIKPPKPPKVLPVSVALSDIAVDARFARLGPGGTLENVPHDQDVRALLKASIGLSHGMVMTLDQFGIVVAAPTQATIKADGGVHLADTIDLRHIKLRIDTDTTELHRRVDKLELAGPASVVVTADGAIDDLTASLTADTTTPRIAVRVDGHLFKDYVALKRLGVESPFAKVDANGEYHFNQTGHGELHVDASDLRPLALLGAPGLAGSIKLDANVKRDDQHLTAQAKGIVNDLRIAKDRIGRIDIDVNTVDFGGHARIAAQNLDLGGKQLLTAKLTAGGNTKQLEVAAIATGAEGIGLDVAVAGEPRYTGVAANGQPQHLAGLVATIQRLRFRAGGTPWKEDGPATVNADIDGDRYALTPLGLNNYKQHVTVEGKLAKSVLSDVHVDVKHFDLSQLPAALSPGHALPHSDLQATLEASGPLAEPNVGAHFFGNADGRSQHDLIRFTTTGDGRLEKGRVKAKVFVTIGGQKASATVDAPLPLRPNQPLDIAVNASVLLNPWFADLLVPKAIQSQPILLYRLGAKVTAQGSIKGTTSDPKINASARVARWGAADSHGDLAVSVEYLDKRLNASSTVTLSELPLGGGKAAGLIEATAELPIDLAPTFSGLAGRAFDTQGEWHGVLNLKHVDVAKLPWEALDLVPFVNHGWVDARAELSGTEEHPHATIKFDCKDLVIAGVPDVAAGGNAKIDGVTTTGDMQVSVRGADALIIRGAINARSPEDKVTVKRNWKQAPMTGTIDIPGFPLTKLALFKALEGTLHGASKVSGTWANPTIVADMNVANLRSGKTAYRELKAQSTLKNGTITTDVNARQTTGSTLTAHVALPLATRALQGTIEASHFLLDLQSDLSPVLRSASGELDGKLTIAGTGDKPRFTGELALTHGEVALALTAISYHDAGATLAFDGDGFAVRKLHMLTGTGGTLDGEGRVSIRELEPQTLTGKVSIKQFPIKWDTTTGLADAEATLDGHRETKHGGFLAQMNITHGRVVLTDDNRLHGLIPSAQLEDVKVAKARPEPVANPLDKPRIETPASQLLTVAIVGPMTIQGNEVTAEARVDMRLHFGSPIPTAVGTLTFAQRGQVKMFGQSYVLERGRLSFGNVAQPELALRLSRPSGKAKIGLDLGGSVRQPTMNFWSEPATAFTPAAVAEQVTGQSEEKGKVSKKGVDEKVTGPISNLIAVSFKQSDPADKAVDVQKQQAKPLPLVDKQ